MKKTATPYFSLGFTNFGDSIVCFGLKDDSKIYLAVWNLKGEEEITGAHCRNHCRCENCLSYENSCSAAYLQRRYPTNLSGNTLCSILRNHNLIPCNTKLAIVQKGQEMADTRYRCRPFLLMTRSDG